MADPQVSLDSMVHHGRKLAEDAASAVPSLPTAPLSPSAAAASCGAIRQGLDHPWNGDKNSRGMSVWIDWYLPFIGNQIRLSVLITDKW